MDWQLKHTWKTLQWVCYSLCKANEYRAILVPAQIESEINSFRYEMFKMNIVHTILNCISQTEIEFNICQIEMFKLNTVFKIWNCISPIKIESKGLRLSLAPNALILRVLCFFSVEFQN